jgi:hypothetical protein
LAIIHTIQHLQLRDINKNNNVFINTMERM